MASLLTGIHHVTALAKDPKANHAFYTSVLGMRMVKKTVNFDDPLTYHLYYGDHHGAPGTLLTHFPHPTAKRGVHGSPEIIETRLRVAAGSIEEWAGRLTDSGIAAATIEKGGERRLDFADHDGMRFALVEDDEAGATEDSIRGIEGVVIHVPRVTETRRFLTEVLGFEDAGSPGSSHRFVLGQGQPGQRQELCETPVDTATMMGAGIVHLVAWRVPSDETQAEVARALTAVGIAVTPVMDRQYFRSIYFRIPGGVIFEVATDGPGFDVDEPLGSLGQALKLPPQYESRRDSIEASLMPIGHTARGSQ